MKLREVNAVGRRKSLKGTDLSRLVIATVSKDDVEALERLGALYGHNSHAGVIRFVLRRLAQAERGERDAEKLSEKVRLESSPGTKENAAFVELKKVPVNLGSSDNAILEDAKARWELSSFAQVVRLAIRYSDAVEEVAAK